MVWAIPLQEVPRGAVAPWGGTVGQGDPIARDPQGAVEAPPGGTVGRGDPFARDPRRSLVELRVTVMLSLILPIASIIELGLTPLISPMIIIPLII